MRKLSLSGLLTLSLSVLLLASCGESSQKGEETLPVNAPEEQNPADTAPVYDPGLPERDFGGADFNVMLAGADGDYQDVLTDSIDGDRLNDAVYERKAFIESTYNVKLVLQWGGASGGTPGSSEMHAAISKLVMSGDDVLDVIGASPYCQCGLAQSGYLMNLKDLPYVNLSQPWWDQNVNSSLCFYDHIFFSVGDFTTIDNRATSSILVNKGMIQQFDLENPYELVRSGKWTMDKMIENSKIVAADLNGDSVMTEEDRWGFSYWNDAAYTLMHSANAVVGTTNANGEPEYCADSEHFTDAYLKVVQVFNKAYAYNKKIDNTGGQEPFSTGNALYHWALFYDVIDYRDLEIDFGLLPPPKMDEAQKQYCSDASAYQMILISVPITVADPERAGILLEAMSAKGKEVITPAFYDVQLATKSLRDEDSVEMLQLICDTQLYDIGYFFKWGDVFSKVKSACDARSDSIASVLQSCSKAVVKDVETCIEAFTKD